MKMLLIFTHPHVFLNFYDILSSTERKYILKNVSVFVCEAQNCTEPIDLLL